MNPRNLKFLQMFENFSRSGILTDEKLLHTFTKEFIDLDYQMAVDVWDYIASSREFDCARDANIARLTGDVMFDIFHTRAPQKCIKAIMDNPSIRRAVFQYANADYEPKFLLFTDLLVSGKVENGDEILKCLIKNEKLAYGDFLKRSLERIFIELLKKNPAKIEMSKKLTALLLTYVKKIKTNERAMLEQRLREIM